MIDLEEEQNRKTRCFLVGKPGNDLRELENLAETLGMETSGKLSLSSDAVKPVYGMGKGKAEEINSLAKETESDCIIFDFDLEPTKQRNWEKLSGIPCFDRQEVIIRIFAERARTKEAALQVELARLTYSLPRLQHSYGEMSRQRGGSYGSKGSGETQLELDQRSVREKINQTKKELEKVSRTRNTQRKKRSSVPVPECALIGYTNAGKSSLLNALTGAKSFVEDKLFATLDPLTRKLNLKDGNGILLTDTVGFISNLPHSLIDAFKSTLSTARNAALLLIVIDADDDDFEFQYRTVRKVLEEIGADEKQFLVVLNKYDLRKDDKIRTSELELMFPENVFVSAKTGFGFEKLSEKISEKLLGKIRTLNIPFSYFESSGQESSESRGKITEEIQAIRKQGIITSEEWLSDKAVIKCRIPEPLEKRFEKFIQKES